MQSYLTGSKNLTPVHHVYIKRQILYQNSRNQIILYKSLYNGRTSIAVGFIFCLQSPPKRLSAQNKPSFMYRPSQGSISLTPLSRKNKIKKQNKEGNQSTGVKNNRNFQRYRMYHQLKKIKWWLKYLWVFVFLFVQRIQLPYKGDHLKNNNKNYYILSSHAFRGPLTKNL